MKILLLTGPGGDAQGWGDMKVTESMRLAAESLGHPARIAYVADEDEFLRLVDKPECDIVWSALYHITPNEAFIGRNAEGLWVADVFDERKIPYIGSDSRTMKAMIDKFQTHEILAAGGVAVPSHVLLHSGDDAAAVTYPAFVKPICESRSVGISDESVVHDEAELGGASPSSRRNSTSRPWSRSSCRATSTRPSSAGTGRRARSCRAWSPSRTATSGTTASCGATSGASA